MKLFDFCQSQKLSESQPGVMHMPVQGEPRRGDFTLGQSVRTLQGTPVTGVVERISQDSAYIRTESGKIFKTPLNNIQADLNEGVREVTEGLNPGFDPDLAQTLKQREYTGPVPLKQLGKNWIEAIGDVVDHDDLIMVQGNDPEYDSWVAYVPGLGKYAYGAEMGYTTGNAQRVERDTRDHGMSEAWSDPSGILAAAKHDRSFIVTAEVDGKKRKFRVRHQNSDLAKEKFLQHHAQAKILNVQEEGVKEASDGVKYVVRKGKHGEGPVSTMAGQEVGGVVIQRTYDSEAEAQAHADILNGGPDGGYRGGDVAYVVSVATAPETDADRSAQRDQMVAAMNAARARRQQGVGEGYWQDAVKKAEADRSARKGKPFEKNPLSHDEHGVYKGDKDLAGNPVPKRKQKDMAEGSRETFHGRTDDEIEKIKRARAKAPASPKGGRLAPGYAVDSELEKKFQAAQKRAQARKQAREDGQQIDELKSSTLQDYRAAAQHDVIYGKDSFLGAKAAKRKAGIKQAGDKLRARGHDVPRSVVADSISLDQLHAHNTEPDHEVNMAKADLYKLAKYALKLHDMLRNVPEVEGIQGWQQAKITKAADYISSVYHSLDYDTKFDETKKISGKKITEGRMKDIATHDLMRKLKLAVDQYNAGTMSAERLSELTVKYAQRISTDTRTPPHAVLRVIRDHVVRNIQDLTTESLLEDRAVKIKNFLTALGMAASLYAIDAMSIKHSAVYKHIEAVAAQSTDPAERARAERDLDALLTSDDTGKSINDILDRYGFRSSEARYGEAR